MHVTFATRYQDESIESIKETETSSNQSICSQAYISEFCSNLLLNRQPNFRLVHINRLRRRQTNLLNDDLFK